MENRVKLKKIEVKYFKDKFGSFSRIVNYKGSQYFDGFDTGKFELNKTNFSEKEFAHFTFSIHQYLSANDNYEGDPKQAVEDLSNLLSFALNFIVDSKINSYFLIGINNINNIYRFHFNCGNIFETLDRLVKYHEIENFKQRSGYN